MTVKDLGDLVIYAGAVAAALSAIAAAVWWIFVRPFTKWLREQITATQGTAEAVHAEMSPNHGTSMRDAVDRAEVKLDRLDERLDDHIRNHPGG